MVEVPGAFVRQIGARGKMDQREYLQLQEQLDRIICWLESPATSFSLAADKRGLIGKEKLV